MKPAGIFAVFLLTTASWAAQQYSATGMVLKVDEIHKSFVVSCQSIPGLMGAMTMPFDVREAKELKGLAPGTTVDFTLIVDDDTSYAEHVIIRRYQSVEQDPFIARQLKTLNRIVNPASGANILATGATVPDFTLVDQNRYPTKLSQFAGKVIAINFIYTSCALPNFCYRTTNNFGVLQKRFRDRLGRELVLLTVTFDPARDQPEILARYARTWKADSANWHFLTGPIPDVRRVTDLFGVDFFNDEGLMNHSLHTAIIDQHGKLVTNIEGNLYTPDQLGDLVESVLNWKSPEEHLRQAGLVPHEKSQSTSNR